LRARATGSRRRQLDWPSTLKRHNLAALPGGIWGGHGWGNLDWPSGDNCISMHAGKINGVPGPVIRHANF
jgi:hypothetical protein